jgi:DNA replication protein DnaC
MSASPAVDAFRRLRLTNMAQALDDLLAGEPEAGAVIARLAESLAVAQENGRRQRRLDRLARAAKLRHPAAALETLRRRPKGGLDQRYIDQLADCEWVRQHEHLVITGPAGSGKSHLACAWGTQALRQGWRVRYFDTHALLDEWRTAKHGHRLAAFRQELDKADLLILDDFLALPVGARRQCHLTKLLLDRHERASTLIVSPLPMDAWYRRMPDATMTELLVDRYTAVHHFALRGDSLRARQLRASGMTANEPAA